MNTGRCDGAVPATACGPCPNSLAQGVAVAAGLNIAFGRPLDAVERKERVGREEGGSNSSTIPIRLGWLRVPSLPDHAAESDFDKRAICDGSTDLYADAPAKLRDQLRPWIRLWVAVPEAIASEQLEKDRRDTRIILDEMPRLGYLLLVMCAYTMVAGAGAYF